MPQYISFLIFLILFSSALTQNNDAISDSTNMAIEEMSTIEILDFLDSRGYSVSGIKDRRELERLMMQVIQDNKSKDTEQLDSTEEIVYNLDTETESETAVVDDLPLNSTLSIDDDVKVLNSAGDENETLSSQNEVEDPLAMLDEPMWNLIKQQIERDLAPFLMLVPGPVKRAVKAWGISTLQKAKRVLSGAMGPMAKSAGKLLRHVGEGLVATGTRLIENADAGVES
eukprot:gene6080-12270_t